MDTMTYEIDPVEEHEDSLDKKVSSDVTYDWDYLDHREEIGEMSLPELISLYENLYIDKEEIA